MIEIVKEWREWNEGRKQQSKEEMKKCENGEDASRGEYVFNDFLEQKDLTIP